MTPEEAEQVIDGDPTDAIEQDEDGEIRFYQLGLTETGRCLLVVTVARRKDPRRDSVPRISGSAKKLLAEEVRQRAVLPQVKRPMFATEEEEAAWYPKHPQFVEALFKQAEAEGKLGHGTAARVLGSTTATTIRMNTGDLAKAKVLAEKKGLRYQTYLKMLLHEALIRAEL